MQTISKIIIVIILILNTFFLSAQEFLCDSRTDFFNNYYKVEKSKIEKYSPDSNLLHTYENISLGEIDFFDISNPYKLLILHKKVNKIVITDNKLSVRNTINFLEHSINLSSACWYSESDILIYDKISSELIVFSWSSMKTTMTKSFIPKDKPILMFEQNEKLFIVTKSTFYIFNMFLGMERRINTKLSSYAFKKGVIYTYSDDK
ncbi:MAG: hypothetical protein U9Q83_11645 [Bacteroidota bacterium]|nr:hypothetical protein [Bacteroidota bacterium]